MIDSNADPLTRNIQENNAYALSQPINPITSDDLTDRMTEDIHGVQFPRDVAEPTELTLEDKVDWCAHKLTELTAKVDNLTQGVMATYTGVHNLVTMLQAVQQVASMMPGGKKIAKAMMDSQNGTPNNG